MVCTWMDDEFIVSIDAVVCGELVVHCAALMQNACRLESNLCQRQPSNLLAVHSTLSLKQALNESRNSFEGRF